MNNRLRSDRRYSFIYFDKKGNELFHVYHWFPTLKYAKNFAKVLERTSNLADLHRIKVKTAFL